jgi:dihydropyrimidine dehydrogenase (NAD+) subunit PreT
MEFFMSEFQRPKTEQEYHANFKQIKPLMNETQAHVESGRCLFCYDAPCIQACPTGIDIPLFIRQIHSGNIKGSAKTIYRANYFGKACGQVCPTEVLCEGSCVFNGQELPPIEIGRLQAFATDKAIADKSQLFQLKKENGKKVAIIGAGPAGISAACELRLAGFTVEIFEAREQPSGLTLYGVAPYKIDNKTVLDEMDYLQKSFDYTVHYNTNVDADKLKSLENNFDAILLAIGLGATSALGIPGEDLENCLGAIEFINDIRIKKQETLVGKNVIVLGGGNTAMDAASEAARMGAENASLCYRRSNEEMRAYGFEYDLAKSVGVFGLFNIAPLEILGDKKVEGIKFIRTKVVDGKVINLNGTEFTLPCDMVIKATGQSKFVDFLAGIEDVVLEKSGKIIVNGETGQTGNPKYFAAGDALNGGKEVVNAAAEGKMAAQGIINFLM